MASEREMDPVEVGDRRQKHVTVITEDGEHNDHGNVYLRHSEIEFVVSTDAAFPVEDTTRYEKDALRRVEVIQHHSTCFITTAIAEEATLDTLRAFRDETLAGSPLGRSLVHVYEIVSPPIAATLARHPNARTTRSVRWLVERCASLARYRSKSEMSLVQSAVWITLILLYVVGLCSGALGHAWIRLGEITRRS